MQKLFTYAKFRIHPNQLEAFKELARQASEIVNEQEPGTLFYEWFMTPDETECVALDCYRDLDALKAHIGLIGPIMRNLMAISDRYLEIYGKNPTEELLGHSTANSSDFYGAAFLSKLDGLRRTLASDH